jgi:hypothetical protein
VGRSGGSRGRRDPSRAPPATNAALRAVLPCDETKIVRDDRVFDAVRVACGRFGVIYSFVLEVRRQFRVVQVVTRPDAGAVLQALRDGQRHPRSSRRSSGSMNVDAIAPAFDDARGVPYFCRSSSTRAGRPTCG